MDTAMLLQGYERLGSRTRRNSLYTLVPATYRVQQKNMMLSYTSDETENVMNSKELVKGNRMHPSLLEVFARSKRIYRMGYYISKILKNQDKGTPFVFLPRSVLTQASTR